jgi:2-desacetyl-2-hydroxyethyl bacteriochlorophyllide A dehydrogenase
MCDSLLVPEANLYPSGDLPMEHAAAVEMLAIGAHAVRRSGASGGTALVIGAGPIGIGTALFARIAGQNVTLLDTDLDRLIIMQGLGFATIHSPAGVAEATGGNGFDLVYDATGNAASMQAAFAYVAHGGAMILVSVVKDSISFSDPEFHKREMTLIGSRNALRQDFDHVIASLRNGSIPMDQIITHRTTLAGAVTDLPKWAGSKAGLVKAVIYVG